jgi:hypothetical protein
MDASLNTGRERIYLLRDRVAYAIFMRKELARKTLFALSLGLGLVIVSSGLWIDREMGPAPGWRIYLPPAPVTGTCAGLVCAAVSVVLPFWGGVSYFLALLGLVALHVPEILGPASILIFLTLFLWLMTRPQKGAMAALVLIPFLEVFFGLGEWAPLGFACFYPASRAVFLTGTAFMWVAGLGLLRGGVQRFGFEGGGLMAEKFWLTRSDLIAGPWSGEVFSANSQAFAFVQDQLFGKGALVWPFLIQIAVGALAIWALRLRYRPVGFHDRLALEYLTREGQRSGAGSLRFLGAPLGVSTGALVWIGCQALLSVFFPGVYTGHLLAVDVAAAILLIPVVLLHYHGDPIMPQEFSHPISKPQKTASSSFRIPTPSEMKLQFPGPADSSDLLKEVSQVRLKSWKDKVDLEWEGNLPDGRRLHYETDREEIAPKPRQPAPEGFEVGARIDGQYRIEAVLRGGMGVVYIVTDEFSEVRYAVKTLREDLRANNEATARFTSEAKTWIRLGHHPSIVQAMYYREIAGRPLLFLEYIDGTDLEEIFNRPGPGPTIESLVDWGIQICEGMHYASTRDFGGGQYGLVHRDIKPGNVMLTHEGRIKITDFGLAKAAEAPSSLTREKVGLGTLKYMAPEQVKDAKHVDLRADIYAVGTVLYEGFVGHPPFTDEDSINLYMSVLSKDPVRIGKVRPDCPEELDRIIMRCLQKDRDQRYTSFEEFGWALRRFKDKLLGGSSSSHIRVVS